MPDRANITVVDSRLRAHIDTVTGGAATSFLRGARQTLGPIMLDAIDRVPVKTSAMRDAFSLEERIKSDALEVSIVNTAAHMRYARFSVRTEKSLNAEAGRIASAGKTPDDRRRIFDFIRRRLTRAHGQGAPDARIAGRSAIVELVRKPARRAAVGFIEAQRANLSALARESV